MKNLPVRNSAKWLKQYESKIIYIVDFWDTRREPKNQAKQTE